MNYTEKTRSMVFLGVLLFLSSCALLFFSFRLPAFPARMYSLLAPIQNTSFAILDQISSLTSFPQRIANAEENERLLQDRLATLTLELTQAQSLRKENETLRQMLEYTQNIDLSTHIARVRSFNPATPHAQFSIDIGQEKQLKVNDTVASYSNDSLILIGRVVQVAKGSAQVLPITNQASNITARTLDGNHIGLASGTGKSLLLRYIDADARNTISVGTIVVSADESVTIVPGLPIGTVIKIREDRQNFLLELLVEPFVRYSSLDYVLVIQQ